MDKAVSDLIDANYVRHLDGPASGGCFTALVILRATTKDMTLISERWRFDLAEMKHVLWEMATTLAHGVSLR